MLRSCSNLVCLFLTTFSRRIFHRFSNFEKKILSPHELINFLGSPKIWLSKNAPILFKLGMLIPYNIPKEGISQFFEIRKKNLPPHELRHFLGSPKIWLSTNAPILFNLDMLIPYNIPQVGPFFEFWISEKNFSPPPPHELRKFLGSPQI